MTLRSQTLSILYRSIEMGFDFYRARNEGGFMKLYLDLKGIAPIMLLFLL